MVEGPAEQLSEKSVEPVAVRLVEGVAERSAGKSAERLVASSVAVVGTGTRTRAFAEGS